MHSRLRPRQDGFILAATLIVIAILAAGAAYFAARVETMQEGAFHLQAGAEAERDAHTSRQMLLFAFATEPRSGNALLAPDGALVLDGRPYAIGEHTQISVQDERGLLNVNVTREQDLRRFLAALGLPLERQSRLIDTLADYIDIDDLKRINGAERADYDKAGLAPPANDFLVSHDELKRIPGWVELFGDLHRVGGQAAVDRVLRLFGADRTGGINVNTAPREVLRAVGGLDPRRIEALLVQRKLTPFVTLAQLLPFANGPLDDENTQLVGASSLRVTHSRDDLPFLLECRLVLTPSAIDVPVQANQCRRRLREPRAAGDDDAVLLVGSLGKTSAGFDARQNLTRPEREINSQFIQPRPEIANLAWLRLPAARR